MFDYGRTSDRRFYYAMELLDGTDLHEMVRVSGPQPQARVRHVIHQVAAALVYTHGHGLIHRDIKPSNIMVTLPHRFGGATDMVKLLDFGLVKEMRAEGGVTLTETNAISGTPQYMSPETILSPDNIDARSDLYAVGAVAYFLLTGRPVFTSTNVLELCSHHLHRSPEPIAPYRMLPLSPKLEAIVLDCLKKDPDQRPASAFELQAQLAACTDVGVWTPDDAAEWWTTYGERLGRRNSSLARRRPRSSGRLRSPSDCRSTVRRTSGATRRRA